MVKPPEGTFDYIVKQFNNHNQSCESLEYTWFGRKGGVTCFNEITSCDGWCGGLTFWYDGLSEIETPETDYLYCKCCLRRFHETGVHPVKDE